MAFVLTNTRLFVGGADLTSVSNKVELAVEHDEKDVTTFLPEGHADSGWKKTAAGLASAEISAEGFWEAEDASKVDNAAWAQLGAVDAWSAPPVGAALGSLAWFGKFHTAAYTLFGDVGDVAPWKLTGSSSWPVVRGVVAHPPGTARTATGVSTPGIQLGALSAGQRLYVAYQVLSMSGGSPTISFGVNSDDNSGFTTPSTVTGTVSSTFTSAPAAAIFRTDGSAITDDWFRIAWTIGGTTPSILFLAVIGIK